MTDNVESFLRESIKNRVFTGASFAIKKGKDPLVMNSVGTLAETDTPVNQETLFDMASCTKLFVSLVFMRLM
ncbi:MAG TPA: hypothetical protein DHW61_09045, partial [Lachnoclostridium phytofermentans]|nr:hypothetical protein [Lachnoclostridium phytofermentans]